MPVDTHCGATRILLITFWLRRIHNYLYMAYICIYKRPLLDTRHPFNGRFYPDFITFDYPYILSQVTGIYGFFFTSVID